jgi:hypothetical protein
MAQVKININKLNEQNLSPITIASYKSRINTLTTTTNKSIEWVMQHPIETLSEVKRINLIKNASTLSAYIVVICKMYSLHPELIVDWSKPYTKWQQYLKHYRKKEEDQTRQSKMTDKQQDKVVDWEDVTNTFCELQKSPKIHNNFQANLEYILLAVLLNIKPKRADLGAIQIVNDKNELQREGQNHIIFNSQNKATLVLQEYKTAKKYGAIKEDLPENLIKIIKESLDKFPRTFLLVSAKTHKPYTNNAYSHFVKRTFEKYFKKAMGISLWRNIYIRANIDFNDMAYNEMEHTAHLLGHNVNQMFKTYRKIDMKQRSRDTQRKPVTCQ